MSRILIVEDERHLAEGLRFNLEVEGYQVDVVETGEEALQRLVPPSAPSDTTGFDLVVLDIMLPGKDGFAVMSEMRAASQFVPTLMLTARGRPDDVIRGFAAGADDYLTKPFELAILIARLRGLLRRRDWSAQPLVPTKSIFTFGAQNEISVHFDLLELRVRENVFRLTLMETNVLRYLIEHEGKPVSRKTMLEQVWALQENTDTRPIDNFIVRLRRYIEADPTAPRHLLTVRGIGYKFIAQP